MRKIYLTLALVMAAITAMGTVSKGYYKSLDGKSGQALKDAIFNLIRPHTAVYYSSLWYYFCTTDCRADDPSRVWDMYSNEEYYFRGSSSVPGMNKEHSLPKSWWGGGDDITIYPSYTDLYHLYPSDAEANTAKLHWPLGEVSTVSFNNGVSKTGTPKTGQGGGAGTVFEPDDQYKGDFARTYFYMATCYQDYTWKYTFMMSNNSADWKTLNEWSVALLLRWAREDPVSDKEKNRNDAVSRIQNNRNPFIDNPELIEYIWGDKQGQVYNGEGGDVDGDPEIISPTQGTVLDFGEVAIGKSLQYTVYIKGQNLTNDLSVQLYKNDYKMFSINVTSIDRTIANSEDGYPLVITYTPTTVGDHTAKLLISDGGLVGSIGVELLAKCCEVPTLTAINALPATEITDNSYLANWEPATQEIDHYLLTRTVYDKDNNIVLNETLNIDAEETSYGVTDFAADQTQTYSVQTSRLGYESPASNVITVTRTGIDNVFVSKPLAIIPMDGAILVKCSEPLGKARIFNVNGQLVKEIRNLENDVIIELPRGVYFMTTSSSNKAFKVIIK
ncbi:MAG: endonuclease [Muribaculaceae bacterium]|nr:endonuclease [Muribaculaceae bacterium]